MAAMSLTQIALRHRKNSEAQKKQQKNQHQKNEEAKKSSCKKL